MLHFKRNNNIPAVYIYTRERQPILEYRVLELNK